jgi:putative membrane protein
MNRKASSLTSLGISMALITGVIYFLMYLYDRVWSPGYGWEFRHHGWMMVSGGNGIGIIVLIFWVTLIGAVVLLILGAVCNISRR